jgi:DNA repair protein RecN (Recombination protein N)
MLEYLRIRNFALIEDLKINFGKGFNVLTGETGAGKSIIIGAIGAILGEKVEQDAVRAGSEKSIIEAFFNIKDNFEAQKILKDSGIDFIEDEPIIIRREIFSEGRNRNYINSTPVPLSKLKELGNFLIDIHGQHEHQVLLKVNTHIQFLDKFGKLDKEREEFENEFKKYLGLKNKLEKLLMNEKEKNRMMEFLKYAIDEIDKANLKIGEDIELEKEFLILSNQEKIFEAIQKSYEFLYDNDVSASFNIENSINALAEVEKFDSNIVNIKQKLEEAYYQIEDVIGLIRNYKTGFEFSPERLNEIIERMELIKRLKKKYGDTIEEILNYRDKAVEDLNLIEQSEEEIEKTKLEIENIKVKLGNLALNLSGRRKVVAKLLEEKIENQLQELEMANTKFKVDINYIEDEQGIIEFEGRKLKVKEDGIDNVEFLISPNLGEELKPLRKIASGGEMSRIMLALKTILGEVDKIDTLIFDEIDVGIGGKTSDKVGRKLKSLGKFKQVISVTHQAQIARFADKHFVVSKRVSGNRTLTEVREVLGNDRVYEIARMLAGANITDTTLKHAKELLESAA